MGKEIITWTIHADQWSQESWTLMDNAILRYNFNDNKENQMDEYEVSVKDFLERNRTNSDSKITEIIQFLDVYISENF